MAARPRPRGAPDDRDRHRQRRRPARPARGRRPLHPVTFATNRIGERRLRAVELPAHVGIEVLGTGATISPSELSTFLGRFGGQGRPVRGWPASPRRSRRGRTSSTSSPDDRPPGDRPREGPTRARRGHRAHSGPGPLATTSSRQAAQRATCFCAIAQHLPPSAAAAEWARRTSGAVASSLQSVGVKVETERELNVVIAGPEDALVAGGHCQLDDPR